MTGAGKRSKFIVPRCLSATADFPPSIARCCADVRPGPKCVAEKTMWMDVPKADVECQNGKTLQGSDLTCQELRWRPDDIVFNAGGHRVCASDKVVRGVCAGMVGFAEAQNLCLRTGARLCTADELSKGLGRNSEACTWSDLKRAWSSTPCPNGRLALGVKASDESCLPSDDAATTSFVICCGDETSRYCA